MKINLLFNKRRKTIAIILGLVLIISAGIFFQKKGNFLIKADTTDIFFKLTDFDLQPVKGKIRIYGNGVAETTIQTDDNGEGYLSFTKKGIFKYEIFDSSGQQMLQPGFESSFYVRTANDSQTIEINDLYPAPEPSVKMSEPNSQNQFSHTFQPGWHLMSLPAVPLDPNPEKVFLIPKEILSERLLYYSNALLGYVSYSEYSPGDFGSMRLGQGYWLNLLEPETITYAGFEVPKELRNITLHYGWNMIGTPANSEIPLADIRAKNLSTGEEKSLYDAAMAGWASFPIQRYDNSTTGYITVGFDDWDEEHSLKPWFGYWVNASTDVELIFP